MQNMCNNCFNIQRCPLMALEMSKRKLYCLLTPSKQEDIKPPLLNSSQQVTYSLCSRLSGTNQYNVNNNSLLIPMDLAKWKTRLSSFIINHKQ